MFRPLVAVVLAASCAVVSRSADVADSAGQMRVDLSAIRQQVLHYLESLQIPGKPYGCLKDPKATAPLLYPSCDAAITRAIMGEDLHQTLTAQQRQEWIDYINSFANEDGTYRERRPGHTVQHANGMVIGALGVLGGKQKYPVRFYDEFDTLEEVGAWLEKIDWHNQWGGSHLFWGGMHCFSASRRCSEAWRNAVFGWLDANLDPQTGWWRRGVPQKRPGIDGLGGGAHIWPIYQHHGRRFPYPERLLNSILAMQRPDGSWLSFDNYLDLDALYGLTFMKSLAPTHRTSDIRAAALRHGTGLTRAFPEFMERKPDAHVLEGAVGALGLLQQLLPEVYYDTVKWTDIFSDPRLYQTAAVEALEGK